MVGQFNHVMRAVGLCRETYCYCASASELTSAGVVAVTPATKMLSTLLLFVDNKPAIVTLPLPGGLVLLRQR
jgi:hypothetical protein